MSKFLVINFFPAFFPPRSGGELRAHHFYRALSKNHDITMVTSTDFGARQEIIQHTSRFVEMRYPKDHLWQAAYKVFSSNNIEGELSGMAFLIAVSDHNCEIRKVARRISEDVDYIVHEFPFSEPIFSDGIGKPEIYNSHNFELSLLPSIAGGSGFDSIFHRLYRAELNLSNRAFRVFGTSESDRIKFELFYGTAKEKTGVCPNGIETSEMVLVEKKRSSLGYESKNANRVLFMGSAHAPNVEAAKFINLLAKKLSHIVFIIAGGVATSLSNFELPSNIQLIESFNDELKVELLTECAIFINPVTLGSGTSLKALEALAAGIPMISTPEGVRGIDVVDKVHTIIADLDQFPDAINKLLNDRELAANLSRNGSSFAAENYSWIKIAEKFVKDLASAPIQSCANSRPLAVAFNDYAVSKLHSGGAARVKNLLANSGCNVVLFSFGDVTSINLISNQFIEVTLKKSLSHLSLTNELNFGNTISVNDVATAFCCQSNYILNVMVSDLVKRCNLVIFEHIYMAPMIDLISQIRQDVPIVYSSHNHEESLKRDLYKSRVDGQSLSQFVSELERKLLDRCNLVVCCTEADAKIFSNYNKDVLIVANGCSVPEFEHNNRIDKLSKPTVGFLGSSHGPNVEAAEYIIKILAPQHVNINFEIIGSVCDTFANTVCSPNVVLKGIVSDKDKTYSMKSWLLALNPMSVGGGSSLKLPDYLAHGVPVLSTKKGSRGFLVEERGAGYIRSLAKFEYALNHIIDDIDDLIECGNQAYIYAKQELSWFAICSAYRSLLNRLSVFHSLPSQRSLLIVTYRYTEPSLGGAEEYLIQLIKQIRPYFDWIDLAAVNVNHLSNSHHFGCSVIENSSGASGRIADHFDQSFFFKSDVLDQKQVISACTDLERAWKFEEIDLFMSFCRTLDVGLHGIIMSGFYSLENHNGVRKRWTGPIFSILLPEMCKKISLRGYGGAPKQLSYKFISSEIRATTSILTDQGHCKLEKWFDVSIEVDPQPIGPIILVCCVDEHTSPGDHRPLGLLLENATLELASNDSDNSNINEVDLSFQIEEQIKVGHFEEWIRQLVAVCETRQQSFDDAFEKVRGPHSSAMQEWLHKYASNYNSVLVQGIPFDVIPTTVSTLTEYEQRPNIVTLPHFHGDDRFYYWKNYLESFLKADINLLFSKEISENLKNYGSFKVIGGGGVDISNVASLSSVQRFFEVIRPTKPFFLVLGRKTLSKGYDRIIEAQRELGGEHAATHILMIGPDEDGLTIDQPGVIYLGAQPRDIVNGALSSCCGLISMSQSESFGIVLCEAWLNKKPVIANGACYSFRDLVKNGDNGILVYSIQELVSAMTILAVDSDLNSKLGSQGFMDVLEKYTWQKVGESILSVL